MASRDLAQAFLSVYDALTQGIRVKVIGTVATSGGGGSGGGGPFFGTQQDIFTSTSPGVTFDASLAPCKSFALQIKKLGLVTSWSVVLEGSLDGAEFSQILSHSSSSNSDGSMEWSGQLESPCLYFRSRCTALVLGAGTNIKATILGVS